MLLIQTCVMHQEINKSRRQQGLCIRFSIIKSPMRMLYKLISQIFSRKYS